MLLQSSTMYRLLREAKLAAHRGKARPRLSVQPKELIATGANQVSSWDITYLKSPISGIFFYRYMIVDVWSRKVVGWQVHSSECSELAADPMSSAIENEGADSQQLALHQDNGAPMKGATLKATLEALCVFASYSRLHVSNDNPFSESLFRTLKYRPEYPTKSFDSLATAQLWVSKFVAWCNDEQLHSGIGFVAPNQRHDGQDCARLKRRKQLYEAARRLHLERWSTHTRAWSRDEVVCLNPSKQTKLSQDIAAHAA